MATENTPTKNITPSALLINALLSSLVFFLVFEHIRGTLNVNVFLLRWLPYLGISAICVIVTLYRVRRNAGTNISTFWILSVIFMGVFSFNKFNTYSEPSTIAQVINSSDILKNKININPALSEKTTQLAEKYYIEMGKMPEWKGIENTERAKRALNAAFSKLPNEQIRESDWYIYTYISKNNKKTDMSEVLAQIRHYPLSTIQKANADLASNFTSPNNDTTLLITQITINSIPLQ